MSKPKIIIYSSDTCAPCKTLKLYLDHKGVAYTVLNADEEPHRTDLIKLAGGRLLPTTIIGEAVVRGLNIAAINKALQNEA